MQFIRHNVLWCIHLSMIEYWTRLCALTDTTVCAKHCIARAFAHSLVCSFVRPSVRLRSLSFSLFFSFPFSLALLYIFASLFVLLSRARTLLIRPFSIFSLSLPSFRSLFDSLVRLSFTTKKNFTYRKNVENTTLMMNVQCNARERARATKTERDRKYCMCVYV